MNLMLQEALDIDPGYVAAAEALSQLDHTAGKCSRRREGASQAAGSALPRPDAPEPPDQKYAHRGGPEYSTRIDSFSRESWGPVAGSKDDWSTRDPDAALAQLPNPTVIAWPVVHNTGWGVFSRNLLREMMLAGEYTPLLTRPIHVSDVFGMQRLGIPGWSLRCTWEREPPHVRRCLCSWFDS